jgi:hypothetical protein
VIHRALVLVAVVCCALVSASFLMFARRPREFIDQAASALTSPFHSIVQSDSQWVLHGIPTVLALLVYGVALGYLARYSRGMS